MPFDTITFAAQIDALRASFLKNELRCSKARSNDEIGFIHTREPERAPGIEPFVPHAHLFNFVAPSSNHERLRHEAWLQTVTQQANDLERSIRSVPALAHDLFTWSISFKEANPTKTNTAPLPAYRLQIKGVNLTSAYVKTSAPTTRRVAQLFEDLIPVSAPISDRKFKVDGVIYPANCPVSVARVWTALHLPALLHPTKKKTARSLPEVVEIHDPRKLEQEMINMTKETA